MEGDRPGSAASGQRYNDYAEAEADRDESHGIVGDVGATSSGGASTACGRAFRWRVNQWTGATLPILEDMPHTMAITASPQSSKEATCSSGSGRRRSREPAPAAAAACL